MSIVDTFLRRLLTSTRVSVHHSSRNVAQYQREREYSMKTQAEWSRLERQETRQRQAAIELEIAKARYEQEKYGLHIAAEEEKRIENILKLNEVKRQRAILKGIRDMFNHAYINFNDNLDRTDDWTPAKALSEDDNFFKACLVFRDRRVYDRLRDFERSFINMAIDHLPMEQQRKLGR